MRKITMEKGESYIIASGQTSGTFDIYNESAKTLRVEHYGIDDQFNNPFSSIDIPESTQTFKISTLSGYKAVGLYSLTGGVVFVSP